VKGDLTSAWRRTEEALPEGWRLDSLRCASEGLDEAGRSNDWLAVAIGPHGHEESHELGTPRAP
jgi:hypothetical protein